MKFDLVKPCDSCPFRRSTPMSLSRARALEIGRMMLDEQGGLFPCHKTVNYDEDDEAIYHSGEQHCAGALIFAEKNGNATQMMRIAERLGAYDRRKVLTNTELVFGKLREFVRWMTRYEATR